MQFLEKQFIEQLTAEIDDQNGFVMIAGGLFPPADILRKNAEELYDEAFLEWKFGEWLPGVLLKADEILDKYDNRRRFDDLVAGIKRDTVIPFVGSGMSQPSGFPLWREFLCFLCSQSTFGIAKLNELLDNGDYELAASEIHNNMPHRLFDEQLEHTFRVRFLDEIKGAVRYLPSIFKKDAITLNYDNILEVLYGSTETKFSNVLMGKRLLDFRRLSNNGERCLVKFHGDLSEPRSRILTLEEYEARYVTNTDIRDELVELFKNRRFLFLGCSLSDDRTLSLFENVSREDANTPRHIAFLRTPDANNHLKRKHFLADRSIFPIWYDVKNDDSHDESVESLLVKILKETGNL